MEYTTFDALDIRALDTLYLETIGGDDYYEVRQIVKQSNGRRCVVGRASDWPIIQARAQNAELTALLTASERHSVDAECHVVELLGRLSAYQEHITALEQALKELDTTPIAQAEQAFVERMIIQPTPPSIEQLATQIEAAAAAAPARSAAVRRKCPYCAKRPYEDALAAHIARDHTDLPISVPPPPPPTALALGDPPWRCAACSLDTHARSIAQPALCKKCVIAQTDAHLSNGHQVAA